MYQTVTYLSTRWQKSTFTNITVQIMHTHTHIYVQTILNNLVTQWVVKENIIINQNADIKVGRA